MQMVTPKALAEIQGNSSITKELQQTRQVKDIQWEKHAAYPSFGGEGSGSALLVKQDSYEEQDEEQEETSSIQLSLRDTKMKFESLDVVKQLHDEGEIAQKELQEVTLNSPRVKSLTNLDNDNMSRKSPLMRHLNFAK